MPGAGFAPVVWGKSSPWFVARDYVSYSLPIALFDVNFIYFSPQ
jgi:hypothetical protein